MSQRIEKLTATVQALESLSGDERDMLLAELKGLKKEFDKNEFKLSRTLKDKNIAINVLNNSIANLEETKQHLEEVNEKLEESYHELEQFAYIASHDLKSPLRTISNFAQLLKRRYHDQLDEMGKEFIDYIVSGAVQMHDVICDSLEYSKVGKGDDSFENTDLNQLLEILRLHVQHDLEVSGAILTIDPLPVLKVNKTSIIQLFLNLVSNAIKFRGEEPPLIHISSTEKEDCVEFSVTDNGIGIDEAYREKVFLPFQRLEVGKQPGTGIGLAICKKIVAMHGGHIRFESSLGEGTTFIFTIHSKPVPVLA